MFGWHPRPEHGAVPSPRGGDSQSAAPIVWGKATFLAGPERSTGGGGRIRKRPHDCDKVLLARRAHHDNLAEGERAAGDPSAFFRGDNGERRGCLNPCDIPVVTGSNP
ncbi:hypothetical protein SKAU_G00007010 [Synaphobranchus kaupii]|uniref:Uncharacterized protein n=1 Tax=Synaphobranchus kaupii TaxID=118154 RepID=A0A9Q1GAF2_SYNKA|nr:hypothetical protein SKAU_G00007010 [Synaphobranchus kaupii]